MEEDIVQESGQEAEIAVEAPVDEIGALKEEINRLKTEMEVIRTGSEQKKSMSEDQEGVLNAKSRVEEVDNQLETLVGKFEGGHYREAMESLLDIVNEAKTREPEVVAGGAIERESFLNSKGLENLHGKADLAMELRRHGIPRADVVRLLRASVARNEPTRVEEPTGRVTRPVDENKVIEGYWKKALA